MELTPEERRKIYLEEKAGRPAQRLLKVVFVIVLAMFAYVTYTAYMTRMEYRCVEERLNASAQERAKAVDDAVKSFNSPIPSASATPAGLTNDRSDEGIRRNMLAVGKAITYEQVKKNADAYAGEPWACTGRLLQIQEAGGQTTAVISLDAWGHNMVYVRAGFTTEFVEKDQVYVVGRLAGNYSYTSVAGWNMTLPAIEASAILKPAEAARIRAGKPPAKK